MPAQAHVAAFADVHLPAGLVVAGSLVMAAATVLGAWLALRRPGRSDVQLGAAAGALLVIAGFPPPRQEPGRPRDATRRWGR
jgi:hypothetical protein